MALSITTLMIEHVWTLIFESDNSAGDSQHQAVKRCSLTVQIAGYYCTQEDLFAHCSKEAENERI